ncbi:centrosomal protein of 290 kDa-like [Pristis pectinata]|uniref:centrosomal protein of 290 kDa-like n=1 Tax=Pristis pectinata TaxID=685728 RepID=UPI00223D88F5|nr:centrosomal protein of 290 kDa-like [Pristis pectinata]
MAVPTVHRCLWLCAENEHLQRKLKKLRQKNELLETELSEIQEKVRLQQLMRDFVTTRDAQIQTEPQPWHRAGLKEDNAAKTDVKRNGLLQMYNALQKRYEEEIKTNKEQSEAISKLTVAIHELELQLVTSKQKIRQLEQTSVGRRQRTSKPERDSASRKRVSGGASACSPDCINIELLFKIERLQKERDRLTKEKNSLKNELAGLDKGFFEEIEDLKYALQESAKLNKEYEKCLQKMCENCGLPFPQPSVVAKLKKMNS